MHYIAVAGSPLTIANSSVVFSFYVKEGTQPYLRGRFDEDSFTKRCFFGIDLTDNSVVKNGNGASSVEITFEDSVDGWKKVIFTATYDATPTGNGVIILLGSGDSMGTDIYNYAGDGSTFFHIYGLQCEQGSYPTSYIPTYGSSATRLSDIQSELTIPNGNVSEGTIFYEFDKAQAPNSYDIVPLKIGSNRVLRISQYNPNMRFAINENATLYTENNSYNAHIKVAVSYSGSSVKLFINGNLRATDNTYSGSGDVIVPSNGLQSTFLGCSIESQQLIYFPTALSDEECIALTTI